MKLSKITLSVFLGLLWFVLTGEHTVMNFLLGLLLSFMIILYLGSFVGIGIKFRHIPKVIFLFLFFVKELIKANIRVTIEIVSPPLKMKPGIVKVPLSLENDLQITLLANLLTLTPGTLTLDISEDKKYIFIHGMYIEDRGKFVSDIKNGFEKRIKEIFS
ncbi:MAG: Na+/H+ antiporter subunit E [Ignavibacteria bacterium]|nr:Na+/H+ antiporter subunit E [Ignavibacteria bacterium]